MNKLKEFLKNANWWEVLGWTFVFYVAVGKFGETESIVSALWTGLFAWTILMIGYNWRDAEDE